MNVFEYIYGKNYRFLGLPSQEGKYIKDGNLMVQAINAMQSKGDWSKFIAFCYKRNTLGNDFMSWLFGDPAKFFELMEEAIEGGAIGK